MKRILAFVALLLIFAALNFPQEKLLARVLAGPLQTSGIAMTVGSAGFSLPLRYAVEELHLQRGLLRIEIADASVNLLRNVEASVCGGEVTGDLDGTSTLELEFRDIEPGQCARYGELRLDAPISGRLKLDGLGQTGVLLLGREGSLTLESPGGTLGGSLPRSGGSAAVELGDWDFGPVEISAVIENGEVKVEDGAGEISGVRFEVRRGRLWENEELAPELDIYLRARPAEAGARAKAVIGLLPRAEEDEQGWRLYRITGTLDAPQIIGLR